MMLNRAAKIIRGLKEVRYSGTCLSDVLLVKLVLKGRLD